MGVIEPEVRRRREMIRATHTFVSRIIRTLRIDEDDAFTRGQIGR